MILTIYAGRKKLVDLVEFYAVGEDGKLKELPEEDKYAIPGGKVCSEKQVRTWANKYGYTITKNY